MNNKNGWGLAEMIMLLCILGFFFLIAIILIIKFYSAVDIHLSNTDTIDEKIYYELEESLKQAGNKYLDDKYENISDLNSITISMSKLESLGYLSVQDFGRCNGYVISSIVNDQYISDSFISCDGYESIGYERGLANE